MTKLAMILILAISLSFSVVAQQTTQCPDCKDGKVCAECAKQCADCKDIKACGDCAQKCAECKDGKMCEKCAHAKAEHKCAECKDGKMCEMCQKSANAKELEAFMALSAKFGQPGEHHTQMNACVGTWKTVMKMFGMNGNLLCTTEGTAERKWILAGRFIQEDYRDTNSFAGIFTIGFDNMREKYVSTWCDNMSTAMMVMEGTCDAATKTVTLYSAESKCPMTGKQVKCKSVMKVVDENTEFMEMFGVDCASGKQFKMMDVTYTRK